MISLTVLRDYNWQQRLFKIDSDHWMKMVLSCLLLIAELLTFCVSLTSASSSLSDTLIFRHGRSRVRHSSEKNHIRWGLKAFDNLTLIDYDYETSNSSNGRNETVFEGGGMNATNQSIYDSDGSGTFALAYYSSAERATTSDGWSKISSTIPSSINNNNNNNWTSGGWTTTSSSANPRIRLAKKQIMENIRKDVEEGIEYLRTHAHLLQPTESMPSEKLQPLKLPPLPVSLTTTSTHAHIDGQLTTKPIFIAPSFQRSPSVFVMSAGVQTTKNKRKEMKNSFKQVKDTTDNIMQNHKTFSTRNGDLSSIEKMLPISLSISGTEIKNEFPTVPSKEIEKTTFGHVSDEKNNLNGNLVSSLTEENATGDKFNIHLNNKFEYNSQNHQSDALKGAFAPNITPPESSREPPTKIDSKRNRLGEIEPKQGSRNLSPSPSKLQSDTNDAHLNFENVTKDNNNVSNNLQSRRNSSSRVRDKANIRINPSLNLYPSDEGNDVEITAANDTEQTENEIIFSSNEDDEEDNGDERNINFDLTNDNLNDITPAIYRMDAIELAQMNEMDETSRRNRLKMMKGKDVVTEFLQIVERSMDNNCSAGTAVNLGEGVVDQYAQERFRVKADVAVNRANMLTR